MTLQRKTPLKRAAMKRRNRALRASKIAAPRKRAKSLAKLRNEAAELLQKLVRLKAADEDGYAHCVTCSRVYHWKQMDGGHFLSRRYQRVKLVEEQINPQCKSCNGFPDYFTHKAYEEFMIDRHGKDYVEWLKQEAVKPAEDKRPELEARKADLAKRVAQLEKEIEG